MTISANDIVAIIMIVVALSLPIVLSRIRRRPDDTSKKPTKTPDRHIGPVRN